MMDEMPNVLVEVGAVLYDIGRQPRAAHDFFVRYQSITGAGNVTSASGAGTLTLLLARPAAEAIGVESVPDAVERARRNAAPRGGVFA